jgi:predicted RNA-binding protein Jag
MVKILRFKLSDIVMEKINEFAIKHKTSHRKVYKEEWNKWLEINKEMVEEEIKRTNDLGYKECVKEKMFNAGRYYFRKRGAAPLTPRGSAPFKHGDRSVSTTTPLTPTQVQGVEHFDTPETNKKELENNKELEKQNKPKEIEIQNKPKEIEKPKEKVKVRTYIKLNEYVLTTIDNHIIKYMDNEDYTPAYGHAQFCINNKELLYNEFMNFQKNNIEMDIQNYLKKIKTTYKNRYFIRGVAPLKPH